MNFINCIKREYKEELCELNLFDFKYCSEQKSQEYSKAKKHNAPASIKKNVAERAIFDWSVKYRKHFLNSVHICT